MVINRVSNRRIRVGMHYVYYKVIGHGDPIILVHGLAGSTHWWIRNIDALARHYAVYLVDLPGFGAMNHPNNRFTLTGADGWLYRWMKALHIPQAHFVGHSMGGLICLKLAARHPEVVCSLTLVSPASMLKERSMLNYFFPLLRATRYMAPSFLFILAYDTMRAGPINLMLAIRDLLGQKLQEDLKTLHMPTLLIWGENDTLVPPILGTALRQEIPNARLLVLKNAGHVPMYDQAKAFNTALLSFLEGMQVGE